VEEKAEESRQAHREAQEMLGDRTDSRREEVGRSVRWDKWVGSARWDNQAWAPKVRSVFGAPKEPGVLEIPKGPGGSGASGMNRLLVVQPLVPLPVGTINRNRPTAKARRPERRLPIATSLSFRGPREPPPVRQP
jgi:hypothetical protein